MEGNACFSILSLIVVLSSMGLPGLNGFVGEFTIFAWLDGRGLFGQHGLDLYGVCNDGCDLSGRLPALDVPTGFHGATRQP